MNHRFRGFVLALALGLVVSNVYAQESAPNPEEPATVAPIVPALPPPPPGPSAPPQIEPMPSAEPLPPAALVVSPPSVPPLRIEGPTGFSLRIGLLAQPQFQSLNSASRDKYANNFYVRRTRILLGGTLFSKVEFFLDTDYPNLFLPTNTAPSGEADNFTKSTPGMNVQDIFVTYKAWGDMVKVDMGYMLPPLGHNAVQGATTLYSWDYFNFTFQHNLSNVFGTSGNAVGRDTGLQLRGLLIGNHLEYRVGLFQGKRDNRTETEVEARNFFRVAGRLQINLLDAEPGFFYAGSYLGTKKIASIGGAFDVQDSYKYFAADGFVDMPLGPGVVTAQVNFAYWDGGSFIPALVKEKALMVEAGYMLAGLWLSPIVRFEQLWGGSNSTKTLEDQTRIGGGIAFWPYGHNTNVKAFYTYAKVHNDPRGTNQFNVQWQVYVF